MEENSRRNRRRFAFYLAFVAVVTAVYGVLNVRLVSQWAIGDWLINYRSGFVRRGLVGEIALRSAHLLHLPPPWVALGMQLGCYAVFFYCVWRLLRRSSWETWVVATVVSPATLGFQVLDPTAGFRKELLLLAGLGVLLVLLLDRPVRDGWLVAYTTVLGLVCVLSHEPLIVFAVYLLAALAIGLHSVPRALRISVLPVVVAVGATLLVLRHPGDARMAQQICSSLGYAVTSPLPPACQGAIAYLGTSQAAAHAEVVAAIARSHYWVIFPMVTALALIPIGMAYRALWPRARLRPALRIVAVTALVSAASSSVLFYYALDWGRWIYIHVVCISMLLLFIESRDQSSGDDPVAHAMGAAAAASRARPVTVAALIVYATCWELPHMGAYTLHLGYVGIVHMFVRAL